jgi:hypothetical protein
MPHIPLELEVTRSSRYLAPHTAKGEILCPDRIPQGERSFMMVLVDWAGSQRKTELTFHKPTSGGGDIRFDGPDGPTKKVLDGDTHELLVIYGQAPTAGSAPDVDLVVRDEDKERRRVSMSVGPPATTVQIRAENGTDPAPPFMVPETGARFKAVASPAAAGSFRWASVPSSALEIKGGKDKEIVEVTARAPAGFIPSSFDDAPALCALFTPTGGQAVMVVHRIWPLTAPEEPGPFPVGRRSYTETEILEIPPMEGVLTPVRVTMEALVRYPAVRAGEGESFSNALDTDSQKAKYPLVILAHGAHNAVAFERNSDGTLKFRPPCKVTPVRTAPGAPLKEFKSYEGLEYLASHLASYGFVAVSVNLNGAFDPATGLGDLEKHGGREVSCKPYLWEEAAIEQRAKTILEHIKVMNAKNGADPIFKDRVDGRRTALIGHSRGGEAVIMAHDRNKREKELKPEEAQIATVISIAPTDVRNLRIDIPYLALIGSDDGDVFEGYGLRIYDRAVPPKQMIWIIGAIHNYFCSNWRVEDEVPKEPPVTRAHHQSIAGGYCNLFLQAQLRRVGGTNRYFTGERKLASLTGVEMHHAYQVPGTRVVDDFEDAPKDKLSNTLRGSVTHSGITFDELPLDLRTAACNINVPWFQDTNGLMVEWHTLSAKYTTSLGGISVADHQVLSFRVGQDRNVNPPGRNQDFNVRLRDSAGADAVLRVGDFGTIPPPRTKQFRTVNTNPPCLRTVTLIMPFLKTVRLPLAAFKRANPTLNLASLGSVAFEFNVNPEGKLAFDNIEFSA